MIAGVNVSRLITEAIEVTAIQRGVDRWEGYATCHNRSSAG